MAHAHAWPLSQPLSTSPENGMTLPQRNINVMCGNNINTRRVLIDTRWRRGSPERVHSVFPTRTPDPKGFQCHWAICASNHKQTISNYPQLNGQLFVGPAGNDSRLGYNFRWSAKSRKSTSLPAVLRIDPMSHPCRAVSEPRAWGQAYFVLLQFESMQGNWFDFHSLFLSLLPSCPATATGSPCDCVIVGALTSCYYIFGSQHPLWELRLTCKWFASLLLCNKRFEYSNTRALLSTRGRALKHLRRSSIYLVKFNW